MPANLIGDESGAHRSKQYARRPDGSYTKVKDYDLGFLSRLSSTTSTASTGCMIFSTMRAQPAMSLSCAVHWTLPSMTLCDAIHLTASPGARTTRVTGFRRISPRYRAAGSCRTWTSTRCHRTQTWLPIQLVSSTAQSATSCRNVFTTPLHLATEQQCRTGAGHPQGASVLLARHAWDNAGLRRWIKLNAPHLDHAPFSANQPHYICDPIIKDESGENAETHCPLAWAGALVRMM